VSPPPPPPLVSVVPVGQEAFAGQLLSGFYDVEPGPWRWTKPSFSVRLAVPTGAAEKGGLLRLNFSLPKPLISQRPTTTLKAKFGDAEISKTFKKEGDEGLERALPGSALTAEAVIAEFTVDKPFVPGGADTRTFGVIAVSVELVSK
jgi:hypothetical protein